MACDILLLLVSIVKHLGNALDFEDFLVHYPGPLESFHLSNRSVVNAFPYCSLVKEIGAGVGG